MTNNKRSRLALSELALVVMVIIVGSLFLIVMAVRNSAPSNFVISATLMPSAVVRVTGVVQPFADNPMTKRLSRDALN
ncbi:hypothetical protein TFLX_05279 [Thermoflexales bacterium]|nr:hypothetical protein TFLX_05279 [Thermoflexales bacterium]